MQQRGRMRTAKIECRRREVVRWCAWLMVAVFAGMCDGFLLPAGAGALRTRGRVVSSSLNTCTMGLEIRALRAGDILPAARLLVDVFTEREEDRVSFLSRPLIFAEHVLGLFERRQQNVILVCHKPRENQEDLIGFVEMYTPRFLASQVPDVPREVALKILQPYIANLAVSGAARKQGVASALIGECEKNAREAGQTKITLQVYDYNAPALALYEGLGYQVVGQKQGRRLVGDILFGRSVPASKLSLEKFLN